MQSLYRRESSIRTRIETSRGRVVPGLTVASRRALTVGNLPSEQGLKPQGLIEIFPSVLPSPVRITVGNLPSEQGLKLRYCQRHGRTGCRTVGNLPSEQGLKQISNSAIVDLPIQTVGNLPSEQGLKRHRCYLPYWSMFSGIPSGIFHQNKD